MGRIRPVRALHDGMGPRLHGALGSEGWVMADAKLTGQQEKFALGVASRDVAAMPVGEPGECSGCGEMSGRLVNGYCAPCRDRYARFIR